MAGALKWARGKLSEEEEAHLMLKIITRNQPENKEDGLAIQRKKSRQSPQDPTEKQAHKGTYLVSKEGNKPLQGL